MCARNGFIQVHGFDGRFRSVREAIDGGGIRRVRGEPRKAVSAGISGKELYYATCHPLIHHITDMFGITVLPPVIC